MDVLNADGSVISRATAALASPANDQANNAAYEYSLWANLGDKLSFVPSDLRYMILDRCFEFCLYYLLCFLIFIWL